MDGMSAERYIDYLQPETNEGKLDHLLAPVGLLAGGEHWNKCDVCGRFISISDFDTGKAVRRMVTPDSEHSTEDYETLCEQHRAS